MKKECPEFVRNLSKKLTVQILELSIIRTVIQKMSVSGHCNFCGTRREYVQNLSSFICPEFVQNFLCPEFVQFYLSGICPEFFMSRICPVLFVWNLSRIFYVWNLSSFICPEFV